MRLAPALLVVVAVLGCGNSLAPTADDFEGPTLSDSWTTRKFLPGAVAFQSDVVRAGQGAAQITLRPGDQVTGEEGSDLERAELEEARRLESRLDATYHYEFSVLLPQEFPIVSRLVFAQWKERCLREACTPDNPTLAFRYQQGRFLITHQTGENRQTLYETSDDIRGGWLDFRVDIRFSRAPDGFIRIWRGPTQLVDYVGTNAYPAAAGYSERFYFKVGLYRDQFAEPMVMYVDAYRKEQLPGG